MAAGDQVGTAVLELKTDSATVNQDLADLKANIQGVAGTIHETSDVASNDWATIGRAIAAVSKQLAEHRQQQQTDAASTNELTSSTKNLALEHQGLNQILDLAGLHIAAEIDKLRSLKDALSGVGSGLGLIGTVGAAIGAGVAGWGIGRAISNFLGLDNAIGKFVTSGQAGAAAQDAMRLASERSGRTITDFSEAMRINDEWVKQHIADTKQAADEQKKFETALQELQDAGAGWRDTLAAMDSETVEAAKSSLAAGVSQQNVAILYQISEVQVRALAAALADEKDRQDEARIAADKFAVAWTNLNSIGIDYAATLDGLDPAERAQIDYYAKIGASVDMLVDAFPKLSKAQAQAAVDGAAAVRKAVEETTKLWDEYSQLVIARTGTDLDAQLAAIDRWANDLTAHMQKIGADTAEFYDALEATRQEKITQVFQHDKDIANLSAEVWKQNLEKTAAIAKEKYDFMIHHTGLFRADTIAAWQDIARQAEIAADNWYASWNDHLDQLDKHIDETDQKVKDAAAAAASASFGGTLNTGGVGAGNTDPRVLGYMAAGYSLSEALAIVLGGVNSAVGLPHRASGGPVSAGMPYLVHDSNKPELFVPGRSGSIIPDASLLGGVQVEININGSVLSDEVKIARAVQRAIEAGLRGAGRRVRSAN